LLSVQLLQIYSDGNTSEAAVLAVIVLLTMAALLLLVGIVNRILRLRMAGRGASMNA
jgi:hypothetical protein